MKAASKNTKSNIKIPKTGIIEIINMIMTVRFI